MTLTRLPDWFKVDGPQDKPKTLVLFAHGAGADMDSDFMVAMARLLSDKGVTLVRFNFPYMQQRLIDGKRRPPNRAPALLECFNEAITLVNAVFAPDKFFLLGKSMGGRMAAIVAGDETIAAKLAGVVCLGYPFLPPKGKEVRLEPLQQCRAPLMIIQGERDSFGNRAQLAQWDIPERVAVEWIPDGDHSLKPRKSSGYTEEANLAAAAEACFGFMK
ncbi:alpha/beta fold hydrolase [Shewanella sp.]|uniref:alpha/beta fold hydrolase n=1 Tax=Shewanella sp. TaxID=50422 RepID=UPI00356611D2